MASPAQVRAHRRDLLELTNLAHKDLSIVFRRFADADMARDGLMDLLPRLVAVYGSAAASLGADWYDDLRDSAAARGRFTAIVADLPGLARTEALARWGIGPLFGPTPDFATSLLKVSGGLQKIIANADRETILGSAAQDRRGGWVREGFDECDWCQQFIDGEVHYTEGYDFDAHDFCQCVAVPEFG